MVAPYYPRQAFAAPPHTWSQAELDYLAFIRNAIARIEALEAVVNEATGFLLVPGGDFFFTPGGDRLAMPGA